MISALLPGEKVNLLVKDKSTAGQILKRLDSKKTGTQNLIFHEVKTVDTWIRDYGPIFVSQQPAAGSRQKKNERLQAASCKLQANRGIAFTKWMFNAWGGKYSDLARDNGVVNKIKALRGCRRFDVDIVLEGGSIDINGRSTLLTTEQCLLNPNRNPHLSRKQVEQYLKTYLGIKKVIWLKEGIEGDDTDGHVDDITRFVNSTTVLTAMESDPNDRNHLILKENLEILRRSTDQDGKKLKIATLPMPGRVGPPRSDTDHSRLPASYANFYIGNAAVLTPIYNHKNDKTALSIIKDFFPQRKIVSIECTALVYGLGSIHCVTQQQPV